MKIKYQNYTDCYKSNFIAAAYQYKKGAPWHIYEGSLYDFKKKSDLEELIQEVMEERHVSRKNIKIVIPKYVLFDELK